MTSRRFSPFLWYSRQEGILHYQRLFASLPSLQSIFVLGQIGNTDYSLLCHILAQKEHLPAKPDPKTGQPQPQSKIWVLYQDDPERSYSKTFLNYTRELVATKLFDQTLGGPAAYLPRTEPRMAAAGAGRISGLPCGPSRNGSARLIRGAASRCSFRWIKSL